MDDILPLLYLLICCAVIPISKAAPISLTSDCDDFESHDAYSSLNYPRNYQREWKITVSSGMKVSLEFADMRLSNQGRCSGCRCDYVEIYSGSSTSGTLISTVCGSTSTKYTSSSNQMFVKFVSNDDRKTARGFLAQYDAVGTGILNIEQGSPARCFPPPEQPNCGLPAIEPMFGSSRIVGGFEARPHSWPWQIFLTNYVSGKAGQFCGGSLIYRDLVLTAAHCVTGESPNSLYVKLGAHDKYATNEGAVVIQASRIFIHPEYNSNTLANDYALIELTSSVAFTDKISVVCLPTKSDPHPFGANSITTGWGTTDENGYTSSRLRQVTVPVLSDAQCSDLVYSGYQRNTMLCAGLIAGGKDACQGDSGGPLVVSDDGTASGKFTLIGITSWGYGCARYEEPGVYARVSNALTWISKTIVEMSSK